MTDLPHGFSTDFSKAPEGEQLLIFARGWKGGVFADVVMRLRGKFEASEGYTYPAELVLCWCPIPTPGDDVLKQLAEAK